MTVVPEWPPNTVAILATRGVAPHAIPVSTGVVAGPRLVLIALARRRRSLEHLRADPRVALTVLAAGDIAFTAHARAAIVEDPMAVDERVAAIVLRVDTIQDHGQPRFVIEEGVRWRWTDPEAAARDARIRAALAALGRRVAATAE